MPTTQPCPRRLTFESYQDVDILVLTDAKNPEELKGLLASSHSGFSRARPEKNPLATYHVLWYTPSVASSVERCRVDIFIPGMISLPPIPVEHITYSPSGLPVMPLLSALMHKILAWVAHVEAGREDKWSNDVGDIDGLLTVVIPRIDSILDEDNGWMPDWFVEASFSGVVKYVKEFPGSAQPWKILEAGIRNMKRDCEEAEADKTNSPA